MAEIPGGKPGDFEEMKRGTTAENHAGTLKLHLEADILSNAQVAVHLSVLFLFWTARDWMGFENLCLAFSMICPN